MAMMRDNPVSKPVNRAINYLHSIFQLGFHRAHHHSNWSSYGNSDITSGLTPGRTVCHRNRRASDYWRALLKYRTNWVRVAGFRDNYLGLKDLFCHFWFVSKIELMLKIMVRMGGKSGSILKKMW